jgi:mannose-6-phosphate isomerase-like protein (cupin superfamily)
MPRAISVRAAVFLALSCLPAWAQQAKQKGGDPGISPTTILDRAEVRISRVEIQAGATRSMHAHNDVSFHLWIPLAGTLQITIGSGNPVEAQAGQAFFIKGGTQHGFKNTGSTPGRAMEVFVKPNTAAASLDPTVLAELALSLTDQNSLK